MPIDLNALRDFVAVAQAGSISAAARALGTPISTLSKRLQDLEASLGVRLLERSTRAASLSHDGAAFHLRARQLLADADEAVAQLQASAHEATGHVRLSTPMLFGHAFMGQLAAAYRARHPRTRLEVVLVDRRVDLVEEGFDAAIRVGYLPDSTLIVRPLTQVSHLVVGTRALLGGVPPASPAALADWPCLAHLVGEAPRTRWRLFRGAQQAEVEVAPVITLSSLLALHEAARAGAGLAYLPQFLVEADLAAGTLVPALPGWVSAPVPISVVVPSARHQPLRVRALIDLLVERFPQLGIARLP